MLPIDDFLPEILNLFRQEKNLVITAAPGAGKTTRLPPALLKVTAGKVIVLEPRRMAAIAAAHRIAEENGWSVGEEVGYQVRFANKSSAQSRLIFMTEALLARKLLHDPELQGVEAVILDEFHERSLHVDLALGLLRELQELGRDIKIIIMSATLDADKVAAYLGDCPQVDVPGKLFHLEIHYQKNSQHIKTLPPFYEHLLQVSKEAQSRTRRDILVFLPGAGEIERARLTLEPWAEQKNIQLVPLHGGLNLEQQRRALQKSTHQRIILATNIAESSVTLDGVDTVIDSGLAKTMKQDPRTGFSRLELGRISISSATQRAGRGARQFPGRCYRLWNKNDELSFLKNDLAEIHRVDLSESLLFLAAQGVRDFHSFLWYERPLPQAISRAQAHLYDLRALETDNNISELGKNLLRFPLPLRLAKLLIVGQEVGYPALAALMAALLQERDILKRKDPVAFLGDTWECDVLPRLELVQEFQRSGRASAEAHFAALQAVAQATQQILGLLQLDSTNLAHTAPASDVVKEILLKSFSDRLCRRRGHSERALMVGGRGVKLSPESLVKKSEFFVVLQGQESGSEAESLVRQASGFSKDFVLEVFKEQIQRSQDVIYSADKGQFFRREFRSLFGLPLDEASLSPATVAEVQEKLPSILLSQWEALLKHNVSLAHWVDRFHFLTRHAQFGPENLRNILSSLQNENTLKSLILEALTQACWGETRLQDIMDKNLIPFFENVFPVEVVQTLKDELPSHLQMPSESWIPVHYPVDKAPYLEVRIQEIFGWKKTPEVLWGHLPVTLHLLGPNFRPVQVTSNLESFWRNAYGEVRQELRIRYPRHQWPEDPSTGVPEAKGRRRKKP